MNFLKKWAEKLDLEKKLVDCCARNASYCCSTREDKATNIISRRGSGEDSFDGQIKAKHGRLNQSDMTSLEREMQMQSLYSAQRYQ